MAGFLALVCPIRRGVSAKSTPSNLATSIRSTFQLYCRAARRFEDLRVGDVFRAPSRTLTDAHAGAFQTVSADNHPIHYDVEYARRDGHIAPVVHGLQVFASTAPGATLFPQYIGDDFVAFINPSRKFLKEEHSGYTPYPALEIIPLLPQTE